MVSFPKMKLIYGKGPGVAGDDDDDDPGGRNSYDATTIARISA